MAIGAGHKVVLDTGGVRPAVGGDMPGARPQPRRRFDPFGLRAEV